MKILFSKRFLRFVLGLSFIILLGLISVFAAEYYSKTPAVENQFSTQGDVLE